MTSAEKNSMKKHLSNSDLPVNNELAIDHTIKHSYESNVYSEDCLEVDDSTP